MVNEKIWKTGTISLLVLFLASLGVNVSQIAKDEGYLPYTCDTSSINMLCYKLSKVNAEGVQLYCYFDREETKRFKKCSSGWKLMEANNLDCSKVQVIAYTDNGKYFCDGIGPDVECIKDESIEMPSYVR